MTRLRHVCCSTLLLLIISIALAIPKPDDKEKKDRVLDNVRPTIIQIIICCSLDTNVDAGCFIVCYFLYFKVFFSFY
jgi:hypothetical protein